MDRLLALIADSLPTTGPLTAPIHCYTSAIHLLYHTCKTLILLDIKKQLTRRDFGCRVWPRRENPIKVDFEKLMVELDRIHRSRLSKTAKADLAAELVAVVLSDDDVGGGLRGELERIACILVSRLPSHRATNRLLRVLTEVPSESAWRN